MSLNKSNRLAKENSPYLRQHSDNLVDWYPWSDEAFEKAKSEDKPIFLSIGYSSCHWCHVMEEESFMDPEIAKLINETFVPILVDREERPDIDQIYMKVCQVVTGSGGWPLTIFLTPDKKPFFASTYIPKDTRFGRIGLRQLIPRVRSLWQNNREEIYRASEKITTLLQSIYTREDNIPVTRETINRTYELLKESFDSKHGGFGEAPKFPVPHNLLFLLRYFQRTGQKDALQMVIKNLKSMRYGGIYDQLGYGFHRYSTDRAWRVPHFEKMLYDQALLIIAYTEAYQITKLPLFKNTILEVSSFLKNEMMSPDGVFYSAIDADSEGEEGKFYLWSLKEIKEALGLSDSKFAIKVFGIKEEGNFSALEPNSTLGMNVLYLPVPPEQLADSLGISIEEFENRLDDIRTRLLNVRNKRVRPAIDTKVLTDWNGVTIAALAYAGRILDNENLLKMAERSTAWLLKHMSRANHSLFHRYYEGDASIPGFLDDYAYFIWGLFELFESTQNPEYLKLTLCFTDYAIEHFLDSESGVFNFNDNDFPAPITNIRDAQDAAYPSGNSVMLYNLIRLGISTGKTHYLDIADNLIKGFSTQIIKFPESFTFFQIGVDLALGPSYEIVLSGDPSIPRFSELLRAIEHAYLPFSVYLVRPDPPDFPDICSVAPFVKDLRGKKKNPLVYICRDFVCDLPIGEPVVLKNRLRKLN